MNEIKMKPAQEQAESRLPQGYSMRPVSMKDLDAVVDLCKAWSQAVTGTVEVTRSDLENFWQTPGLNRAEDLRAVFTPLGMLVGYIEAMTLSQPPVHPFIWLRVHPDYEGLGIGEALMAWADQHLSRALDAVEPQYKVSIGAQNVSGYTPAAELMEKFGYRIIRHGFQMRIEMQAEPELVKWPEGVTIKPFDAERDAEAVYRALDEAFSDHFGHVAEPFEQGFERFKHFAMGDEEVYDPSLWFIAMDGDEIAGLSLCVKYTSEDPDMGWVEDLGVRRAWRKRGLGLALLQHSFAEYHRRGFRKVGLWVDASSLTGAVRLYERAGMRMHRQYDRYEKVLREGEELATVALEDA
jgi:mycothiol synthase